MPVMHSIGWTMISMLLAISDDVERSEMLCAVVVDDAVLFILLPSFVECDGGGRWRMEIEWRVQIERGDRVASSDGFVSDKWIGSMYTADAFG